MKSPERNSAENAQISKFDQKTTVISQEIAENWALYSHTKEEQCIALSQLPHIKSTLQITWASSYSMEFKQCVYSCDMLLIKQTLGKCMNANEWIPFSYRICKYKHDTVCNGQFFYTIVDFGP